MPTNPTILSPMPLSEGSNRLREMLPDGRIASKSSSETTGKSFLETLEDSIQQVNQAQQQADNAINALSIGESKDVTQTMIAVQKANLTFQLMAQVRNKLVQAYEEVMRMPI